MELEQFLIDATLEVFTSMIFLEIAPESVAEGEVIPIEANLISLIGLAGGLKGVLALQCPAEVATGITAAMLGMDVDELGEDSKDAIGEIANMVAGGFKAALAEHGRNIELAIPIAVIGSSFRTSGLSGAQRVLVPFTTPLGRFGVELKFVLA